MKKWLVMKWMKLKVRSARKQYDEALDELHFAQRKVAAKATDHSKKLFQYQALQKQ